MTEHGIRHLIFIGAGGTCADVLTIISALNKPIPRYKCVGMLDDDIRLHGGVRFGIPVLGFIKDAARYPHTYLVDCLGSPGSFSLREEILNKNGLEYDRFETVIAPSAFIAESASISRGCIIYPNVIIMAGVHLGSHVTILANTVLNHDVEVGDFTILASGVNVSGRVRFGRACYVGAGASLIQNISVGDNALIGMGSVVLDDVSDRSTVVGNPARCQKPVFT